jgi:hypothetical protein
VVRVMVEGQDAQAVHRLTDQLVDTIRKCLR